MKTVFRITQPPIPLSACFINSSTHRGRAMSQRYETWIQEARIDYLRQRPKPISGPVTIFYELAAQGQSPPTLDLSQGITG